MKASGRITEAPGIGAVAAQDLAALGIATLGDMLRFAPRAYDDRREERRARMAGVDDPSIACRIGTRIGVTITMIDAIPRRHIIICIVEYSQRRAFFLFL